MQIDFHIPLVAKKLPEDAPPVLISGLIYDALCVSDQNDTNGTEKYKRGKLAEKVMSETAGDYSIEEIALIKDVVGKYLPSISVTFIWDYLENALQPAV